MSQEEKQEFKAISQKWDSQGKIAKVLSHSSMVYSVVLMLAVFLPKSLSSQILASCSPLTVSGIENPAEGTCSAEVTSCSRVTFNMTYNFNLPWEGDGNLDHEGEDCQMQESATCHDWFEVKYFVDDKEVKSFYIGGTTGNTQSGNLNFTTFVGCSLEARIKWRALITDQSEELSISNITITCEESIDIDVGEILVCPANAVCKGTDVTLVSTGDAPYSWSTGETTKSIIVTPQETSDYMVSSVVNGQELETAVTIRVVEAPNVSAGPDLNICEGAEAILTASGGSSYLWDQGLGAGNNIVVSPSKTTTYTVRINQNGCSATDEVTVFVNPPIEVDIGDDVTICGEGIIILTAPAGDSYQWNNNLDPIRTNTVRPTSTTTYSVTVTENGCSDSDELTVTVQPMPSITTTPDQVICTGTTIVIEAQGGSEYKWSDGLDNVSSHTITPTETNTYTVTVYGDVCEIIKDIEITVLPEPTANAGPDQVVCRGESTILSASGGNDYNWDQGLGVGRTHAITPNEDIIYTVTVSNADCHVTDKIKIQVVDKVEANIATSDIDQTSCAGESITLSSDPAASYTWSTGATSKDITISPHDDMRISLSVTDENNCVDTTSTNLDVNPVPIADAGPDIRACYGESLSITATGGTSYLWSDGTTDPTFKLTPTKSELVIVEVTSNGCSDMDSVYINADPIPTIEILGNQRTCSNELMTLSVTGTDSLIWETGESTSSISFIPEERKNINLTTKSGFCTLTHSIDLDILPAPKTEIITTNLNSCENANIELFARGADNYLWNTGDTSSTIFPQVAMLAEFTVQGTALNGCASTDTIQIQTSKPDVSIFTMRSTICRGESVTLVAQGAPDFQWNHDDNEVNDSITVTPTLNTLYSVLGTNDLGCIGYAEVTITVVDSIPLELKGDTFFCEGDSTSIGLNGQYADYQWSNGDTEAQSTFNTEGLHSVIVMNEFGCAGRTTFNIVERVLPQPEIFGDFEFCQGGFTKLHISDEFESQKWPNGNKNDTVRVTRAGLLVVEVVGKNGCQGTAEQMIIARPESIGLDFTGSKTICSDSQTNIGVDQAFESYQWSTGASSPSIDISQAGEYSIIVQDDRGCNDFQSFQLEVIPKPSATLEDTVYVCNAFNQVIGYPTRIFLDTLIRSGDATGTWFKADSKREMLFKSVDYEGQKEGTYFLEYHTRSAIAPCTENSYTVVVKVEECICPEPELIDLPPICNNQPNLELKALINTSIPGSWSHSSGPENVAVENNVAKIKNVAAGDYDFTYSYDLTKIPLGCATQVKQKVNILPYISADLLTDPYVCEGEYIRLRFSSNSAESLFDLGLRIGNEVAVVQDIVEGEEIYIPVDGDITISPIELKTDAVNCGLKKPGSKRISIVNMDAEIRQTEEYNGYGVSCNGASDGGVQAYALEGIRPMQFEWNDAFTGSTRTEIPKGIYQVTITDFYECSDTTSIVINEPEPLTFNYDFEDSCFDADDATFTVLNVAATPGPYTISLNSAYNRSFTEAPFTMEGIAPGRYLAALNDANGCLLEADSIDILENIELEVSFANLGTVDINRGVSLAPQINFAPKEIFWSPPIGLSCINCLSPLALPDATQRYTISLKDQNNCPISQDVVVEVNKNHVVNIPPAFSPNNDGVNDYWNIHGDDRISNINLIKIFNRDGTLVYENRDQQPNHAQGFWDGEFDGKEMGSDHYIYYVEVLFSDSTIKEFKGSLMLIR